MSLTKFDGGEVLLIKYNGESIDDPENLKRALLAESASGKPRDTVLEFVNSTMVYSSEIGVMVQFLKTLAGTGRALRLVVSNYVSEMLKTMNIHKIPNLTLHDSLESAQEHFPNVDLSAFE